MKLLLLAILLTVALSQSLINQLHVIQSDWATGCTLRIRNTEEIIDLQTNCTLPNATDSQTYRTLLRFIKPKASYMYFNGWRGYRYFKDPLNYKFKQYDLDAFKQAIATTQQQFGLSEISLPFEDRYNLTVIWEAKSGSWSFGALDVHYRTAVHELRQIGGYTVRQSLEKQEGRQQSIVIRKLAGSGANQQVNLTLDLTKENEEKVDQTCTVVIEEIVPEWFFVDYDELRTLHKFQVFDIELPEHFSKQYFFRYSVPFAKFVKLGPGRYSYKYRLRVRYPRPTSDDSYTVPIGLHPNDKVTIRCSSHGEIWVKEDLLNDRGHGKMFAGRAQDAKSVTMWTYLLTTVICIMVLKVVRVPKAPAAEA